MGAASQVVAGFSSRAAPFKNEEQFPGAHTYISIYTHAYIYNQACAYMYLFSQFLHKVFSSSLHQARGAA